MLIASIAPRPVYVASAEQDRWLQRTPAARWGSLVLCDERFYVTGQDGATTVFKPTPEGYEELAINELNETCNGTPAISDGISTSAPTGVCIASASERLIIHGCRPADF